MPSSQPVETRHHDVENDGVGGVDGQLFEPRHAVPGRDDFVTLQPEGPAQRPADLLVVLDYEKPSTAHEFRLYRLGWLAEVRFQEASRSIRAARSVSLRVRPPSSWVVREMVTRR